MVAAGLGQCSLDFMVAAGLCQCSLDFMVSWAGLFFWYFSPATCLQDVCRWCYYFWLTDMWHTWPRTTLLHQLKIHLVKHKIQVFTGWRSVTLRMPAAKSHSVPSFRHLVSLAFQKSWNLLKQICRVHHSEAWPQLVLLIQHTIFKKNFLWQLTL